MSIRLRWRELIAALGGTAGWPAAIAFSLGLDPVQLSLVSNLAWPGVNMAVFIEMNTEVGRPSRTIVV